MRYARLRVTGHRKELSNQFRPRIEMLEARAVPTNLPPGFTETLVSPEPTDAACMAFAPDGRLFICNKPGKLWVIETDGTLVPEPFLQVDVNEVGERGLVGVAFHPDFASNRYVYVYYVANTTPPHSRVSRFTASASNPNVAEPGSEQVILELNNLSHPFGYHVGGDLLFDSAKRLYVAVGDDGNGANAQNPANLLGKMLRINDDGSIPPDNPFISSSGARDEIYAFGLRNPFRTAIQPKTDLIYVNEVGSDLPVAREEVNRLWWGGNYGWPTYQGTSGNPDYTDPEYEYEHGVDPETGTFNCAVTGAAFYGPGVRQFPREYVGDYFFTDYCGSWIKRIDRVTGNVSLFASDTASLMVDLAVNRQGTLYYLSQFGGIYRIDYEAPPVPLPSIDEVDTRPIFYRPWTNLSETRMQIVAANTAGAEAVETRVIAIVGPRIRQTYKGDGDAAAGADPAASVSLLYPLA